jgi:ADP-heptose:LPS heptosyltransferase/GT2 family glycosyltransferase
LYRPGADSPLVSIIIPTCGAGRHIETCLETLRSKTAWRQYEIICIDNIPPAQRARKAWLRDHADKVVRIPDKFNWSRFNNLAVQHADGEFLLFLNDDIEITQDDWLDAMMEHAQRPEVGVVGPQLLYPDGKVQHAGMFLSTPGLGRHAFRMLEGDDPGYFGLARTQRNVIAVTGACMLVRRDSFSALGGFDEAHEVINNDLDYCLRAHAAGQRILFTPHARLIHHELASRDRMEDVFDSTRFIGQWQGMFAAGDPFFSPRLQITSDDYRPDDEPAQEVFVGHPLFRRDSIRRILAVKLDHIGDFLTGLPALRRLREVFPDAELHVLASRAAQAFAEMTDGVAGFIAFEFFHARSELGPRDLTEDDFRALAERLAPYDFDLAVDLRMHPDTRMVMRHVPARWRAGYDHAGQFPFLDIALEWDKDSPLQRKRTHVSDRLLNLVEAIATASNPVRVQTLTPPGDRAELLARLPANARRLFARPVAAVHPGVGNSARQWPAAHYAALCDLLVTRSGMNVVLIGGKEEHALVQTVLQQVAHRRAVVSLAGKTQLKDLPLLLGACALYVGNNSGPKHIAASLGVPTIGIHSGVVDAVEWGPLGERAMALQRNMLCRPCYLLKAEDCPRGMACLEQLTPALVHLSCETLLGGVARRAGRAKARSRVGVARRVD